MVALLLRLREAAAGDCVLALGVPVDFLLLLRLFGAGDLLVDAFLAAGFLDVDRLRLLVADLGSGVVAAALPLAAFDGDFAGVGVDFALGRLRLSATAGLDFAFGDGDATARRLFRVAGLSAGDSVERDGLLELRGMVGSLKLASNK